VTEECYYATGCRWIDGCNAESLCIGRDASDTSPSQEAARHREHPEED
jgi:hypothetical protein